MYTNKLDWRHIEIKKEKRINIKVSEKMMNEFDEALEKNDETKSEVIRSCIRSYIKKSKNTKE